MAQIDSDNDASVRRRYAKNWRARDRASPPFLFVEKKGLR